MVERIGRLAAGAALLAVVALHSLVAGAAANAQVEPDGSGRRPIDPESGEFAREPTARDDVDMRLPAEFMPLPGAPTAAQTRAETGAEAAGRGAGTVLWDNGPLVNCAGCGVGSADESVLQTASLGMTTLGFGHQTSAANSVADDFTVTGGAGWTIFTLTAFAYQTGSNTTSTIDEIVVRIWDGPPGDPGSSVVFGDLATDRLEGSDWTGIYRVNESTTGTATNRPIMRVEARINTFLAAGTYWIEWSTGGTLASGPWAPPITINGTSTTGNGEQSTDGGVSYAPANDGGSMTQQGFPFVLRGEIGNVPIPQVELHKTVGLDPSTCATTDEIVVSAGTQVTYCFEITNTGTVALTRHDLVDSEIGTLLDDFAFNLPPGSGAFLIQSEIIDSTTTNTATWTAFNPGPSDVADDTDQATVIVARAEPLVCNGPTVEFEAGVPPDWEAVNNAPGNPVEWTGLAGCGEAGNYTGVAGGDAACASSDLQGGGSGLYDTELVSAPILLEGATSATLQYEVNYQNFALVDFLEVEASADGGASWTTLLSWNEDHGSFRNTPGETVAIDLTPWIGPQPVLVRWRYYDPGSATSQDWYAQVDSVSLACGGLPVVTSCPDVTVAYKSYGAGGFRECGRILLGPGVSVAPGGSLSAISAEAVRAADGVSLRGDVVLDVDPAISP